MRTVSGLRTKAPLCLRIYPSSCASLKCDSPSLTDFAYRQGSKGFGRILAVKWVLNIET